MIGKRNGWMRGLFATMTACLCFSYACVHASLNDTIDGLYDDITTNPGQLSTLITDYCSTVLSSSAFVKDKFVYNAKYSAFVYLLCSNVSSASSSHLSDKNYFAHTSFAQLGFTDVADGYELCNLSKSMNNDCDLSKNIPKLLNNIMNDYVNMKQAGLYGLMFNYKTEKELESEVVNKYSAAYFKIDLCNNGKHPYPKTCSMMKSYVKNAKNILSEVRILSVTGILAMTSKDPCNPDSPTASTDIFYCGLKDTGASMVSFVNLLYNEMFYYRLFMGYYMISLQRYPSLLADNMYNTNYSAILKKFSSQYIWSKTALSLSLRMMRDAYMAFPFHVGFSMYQEDLDTFGKKLARIAPPIYTLYDKLRNVQTPQ